MGLHSRSGGDAQHLWVPLLFSVLQAGWSHPGKPKQPCSTQAMSYAQLSDVGFPGAPDAAP